MIQDSDFPTDPAERQAFIAAHLSRELGIPFNAAVGITQRLIQESGGQLNAGVQENRPTVPGSRGGVGYAQWTGPRRQDFESAVSGIGGVKSPSANLAYLTADLKQNYPDLIKSLQDPKTSSATAFQNFTNGYEYNKGPYAGKGAKPVQLAKGPDPLDFETPAATPPQPTQTTSISPTAPVTPSTPTTPATVAPTTPKSSGDPLDFENLTTPAATPAPTPSPDNPNEGKGVAATVPQGSLMNDIKVGGAQGTGTLADIATNPVGKLVFQPAAAVGTLAYNHLAPLFGGSALSPETVQKIVQGAAPNIGVGDLVNRGINYLTGGNPDAQVSVPGVRSTLGTVIPAATIGALTGGAALPGAITGGIAGAVANPVAQVAGAFARPEDQPGVETLAGILAGAGTSRVASPSVPPIAKNVAATAQDATAAGGPQFRPGQISSDVRTQKADIAEHPAETAQQVHDFTKAISEKAGVPTDNADTAWVQKVYKTAGNRLDTIAAKTGVTADNSFLNDISAAEQKFQSSYKAANPNEAAQGRKLVDNVLDAFKNGTIDGKKYQEMTQYGSDISQAGREDGAIGQLGQALRKAVNDALERSAKPEDVAEIRDARQQWNTARRLEPMVNDTTGILDPRRVAKEFGGDQTDLGKVAASGGLLPNTTPQGGVNPPSKGHLGTKIALGSATGTGVTGALLFPNQVAETAGNYLGLLGAHPLMTAAGVPLAAALGTAGAARALNNRLLSRPAAQQSIISRAANGTQMSPWVNPLLPGVVASENNQ